MWTLFLCTLYKLQHCNYTCTFIYTHMLVLLYVSATFRVVLDKEKYTAVFGIYMLWRVLQHGTWIILNYFFLFRRYTFLFSVRGLRLLWFLSAPPDKDGNKLNPHKWVLRTVTVSQGMKNFHPCWKAKIYWYNYLVRHFSPLWTTENVLVRPHTIKPKVREISFVSNQSVFLNDPLGTIYGQFVAHMAQRFQLCSHQPGKLMWKRPRWWESQGNKLQWSVR